MQNLRNRIAAARKKNGGEVHAQSLHDPGCDGEQRLVVYYVPVVKALEKMFGDSTNEGNVTYFPKPEFNKSGERIFSTLAGGLWWQYQQSRAGIGTVVLSLILASDEAKCTVATNMTVYPVYGNDPSRCFV